MSLGIIGVIKDWWGPCKNTRHSREVPWQPCAQEPALQVATNSTVTDSFHGPTPKMGGKGWALNLQNGGPKWWSAKISRASNCKCGNQSSDPSRAVILKYQQSRQLQIWRLKLSYKHMEIRQALVPPCRSWAFVKNTAGHIDLRLTKPKFHLATYKASIITIIVDNSKIFLIFHFRYSLKVHQEIKPWRLDPCMFVGLCFVTCCLNINNITLYVFLLFIYFFHNLLANLNLEFFSFNKTKNSTLFGCPSVMCLWGNSNVPQHGYNSTVVVHSKYDSMWSVLDHKVPWSSACAYVSLIDRGRQDNTASLQFKMTKSQKFCCCSWRESLKI